MITREYKRDNKRIENSQILVTILQKEFLMKYPEQDLDITKKPLPKAAPGLPQNLNLTRSEMAQLNLNPSVLSVLCGTLLGDASLQIQTGYANARFQYRHSTRQTEWFMWKTLGPLKDFMGEKSIQFQNPDGKQRKTNLVGGECLGKLKVSSLVSPVLTSLYKILCINKKIVIERHWLNHMNAYFLMALWLDDGSLVGKRQGIFCFYSTPEKELKVLADYIKLVWQIDCQVQQVQSKNDLFHIVISDQQNLYKLMEIIAPLIPVKTMLYKVCFYPTDDNLLQRWTTRIKELVRKEWHDEIDKQYLYYAIRQTDSQAQLIVES
jgi:hypothetical protein